MAVRLADYYKGHVRRTSTIAIIMLIGINAALGALLVQLHLAYTDIALYVVLPITILEIFCGVILFRYTLEPLEVLARAIAHISRQPNNLTPPSINEPRHVRTGLKNMVQTIYDRVHIPIPHAASDPVADDIADTLPCGIIGLDANKNVIYANSRAPIVTDARGVKLLTLQFETGDSLNSWLDFVDAEKVTAEKIWEAIADNSPDRPERRIFDVVAYYEKGAPHGVETRLVTIDRTETYANNEDAIDFISVAAHELRGPITVIRGYLDVLASELYPQLREEQRELMERLDVSASRLSSYINNILNVAKYDHQHLKLHLQEDRFDKIYETIADDLRLRAKTQHRLLSVVMPGDLPTIAADRGSLTEVIANLVDNAIKYSHEGGQVSVTAESDGNFVKCSVHDTGIGIPSSVMSGLFKKFYRSHRSRSSVSGTGLGLFISRAIVESHGGQMGVTSKEGEGSTFTFTVPIYSTVADKLAASHNGNEGIIETSSGWIRNHSKIGGQ